MMLDMLVTRRRVLALLLPVAAWLIGRLLGPLRELARAAGADSLASRLMRLFRSPGSAARIGHAYLRQAPREADERRLLALICPAGGRWQTADTSRLRRMLARQQRDDFAQGRVVRVRGWLLSLTEARLCALAALRTRAV